MALEPVARLKVELKSTKHFTFEKMDGKSYIGAAKASESDDD